MNLRFPEGGVGPEVLGTAQPVTRGITETQSDAPNPPSADIRWGARTRNLADEGRTRAWMLRGSSADSFIIPIPGVDKLFGRILDRAKDEILKRGTEALFEFLERLPGDIGDAELRKVMDLGQVKAPERALSTDEKTELKKVFGDSLDLDKVRVREGDIGLFNRNNRPVTLGNTILVPAGRLQNGSIPKEDLIHEATHAWQFQHGGIDYIKDSIKSQISEGPAAYNFDDEVLANVPWKDLGAEEQAALIEKAYAGGFFNGGTPTFAVGSEDRTDYLNNVIKELRAGAGAP